MNGRYLFGVAVHFSCDTGYLRFGPSIGYCTHNGTLVGHDGLGVRCNIGNTLVEDVYQLPLYFLFQYFTSHDSASSFRYFLSFTGINPLFIIQLYLIFMG